MKTKKIKSRSQRFWNWLQTIAVAIDRDSHDFTLTRIKALEQQVAVLRTRCDCRQSDTAHSTVD